MRIRLMPKAEATVLRKPRTLGVRKQRMLQFDEYVKELIAAEPNEAIVFDEFDEAEDPRKFVITLRGALKRAGVDATIRKLRNREEVRVWRNPPPEPKRRRTAARTRIGKIEVATPFPEPVEERERELVPA